MAGAVSIDYRETRIENIDKLCQSFSEGHMQLPLKFETRCPANRFNTQPAAEIIRHPLVNQSQVQSSPSLLFLRLSQKKNLPQSQS